MSVRPGTRTCLFILLIFSLQARAQGRQEPLRGHVADAKTGLPLAGVNVIVARTDYGTSTDSLGDFSLYLEPGKYTIRFSMIGYASVSKELSVKAESKIPYLTVSMKPIAYLAKEVTIRAERSVTSPGIHTIKEKNLQYIPSVYGDVLNSVTILPGVSSNNELTSAYNVRGQNFTSNLIYLDGFEIYRPYLIQQGIEESQSTINQNMVGSIEFYDGAFPVQYGDKMSSVLVVNYKNDREPGLGGEVNANLLNLGATLHDRFGPLSWTAGFRYAYPSSFTSVLQTKGKYIPRYTDFQFLASYALPADMKLDLLFMTANNTFNLTPSNWTGDFAVNAWFAFRRIALDFSGGNNYRYDSNLLGLRLTTPLGANTKLSTAFAYYSDRESYNENLSYGIFYSPSSYAPQDSVSQLGTGYEFADNSLRMNRLEFKTDFKSDYGIFGTMAGLSVKTSLMDNSLNDSTYYLPPPGPYSFADMKQRFRFNSVAGYFAENVNPDPDFALTLGVRALKYYFTNEFLVSPRASASWRPDTTNSFSLGWGYYYQPPSYYVLRDKTPEQAANLRSQLAVQYQLRYERKYPNDTHVLAEVYYKKLTRQIPYYYTNQLELSYGDTNNYNGYAYGFDLEYHGKLSQRLDTWIGYGYMVARDRRENGKYQRSLLDQTHTIRVFLQDAMPGLHNSQAHVRILFGTGYNYHPMMNVKGPNGVVQTVPDFNLVYPYPFYYRIDMGLTMKFNLGEKRILTLDAEVLNVFDKNNIVSYSWYTIPNEFSYPLEVPNLLSARYFNVGARVEF